MEDKKQNTRLGLCQEIPEPDQSNKNVLLVNIERLKRDSYLDTNVDDKQIRVAVMALQDIIIEKVIGTCLFDTLRLMICENMIEDSKNRYYRELVTDYLFPIFSYGVPMEISIPTSFKHRNAGTVKTDDENLRLSELNEIKYSNNWFTTKVNFYIDRAQKYLICHRDKFPELCCCTDCGCGDQPLQKPYKTGLCLDTFQNKKPGYNNKYNRRW